jgi:DNA-binding transcriptional ArsR family regulator
MASIKRTGFTPVQNDISNIFKALGHPARIAILESQIKERTPCKYLELELQIAKSTLSRHMQVLFDCGIIGYEKILNETYYVINPLAIENVSGYLLGPLVDNPSEQNFRNTYFKTITNPPKP